MKKRTVFILVCALLLAAFTGCGGSGNSENGAVLSWNIGSDPRTLDPQLSASLDSANVINNMFEGLMRESGGKLVPGMAESYEISEDGLVYTFHLRDAFWSDGKAVTASDFEYAWKRACNPDLKPEPAGYAYQMYCIKGAQAANEGTGSIEDIAIKAIDSKTLMVELAEPAEYFLSLTTLPVFMPVRKDIAEKNPENWARNPETAVSNGPFKLYKYLHGDRLILVKNENYWQADKVSISEITGFMIGDSATALSAYQAGDIDIIDNPPSQEIQKLLKDDPTLKIVPQMAIYFYSLNTQKKPFDDINVRKALAYAIDRKAIAENVCGTGEIAAYGIVPPGVSDLSGREFRTVNGNLIPDDSAENIKKAKLFLARAGYPNGENFPEAEVLYAAEGPNQMIAEAVSQMWENNLGIKVKLKNIEWQVFEQHIMNGNFDIAPVFWYGDYNDPITMLDIFASDSAFNISRYSSEKYNELIEKSRKTSGDARMKSLYDAEKTLMSDMPVIPLYYNTSKVMVKKNIKNWELTETSVWYFGNAVIEK